ncbi:unnamed protein product [Hymenolepis diminuta]|uniref:Uncharacterized protein n=1 Tax=Hymenolepis diminuta TaxID=6216 RepID=A0A564Y9L3_HYMDI|nr:unnamed protein product [Hymenolepis diminuta]
MRKKKNKKKQHSELASAVVIELNTVLNVNRIDKPENGNLFFKTKYECSALFQASKMDILNQEKRKRSYRKGGRCHAKKTESCTREHLDS